MKRYVLVRDVLGSKMEVPLSRQEFESAQVAFVVLQHVVSAEERFDAVARNYLDLEADMLATTFEFAYVGFGDGLKMMAARRLINRRLMNMLSTARAYIDHQEHSTEQVFGKNDVRAIACNRRFDESYDRFLGYRVLEALRNYSQHFGFPIHVVRYSSHVERDGSRTQLRQTISPIVDVSTLKADKKFKAAVLRELEVLGTNVDLKPLILDYMAGLATAHKYFREEAPAAAKRSNETLEGLIERWKSESADDQDTIGLFAVAIQDSDWSERVPLTTGLGEYGEYLAKNHLLLSKVSAMYVSSRTDT